MNRSPFYKLKKVPLFQVAISSLRSLTNIRTINGHLPPLPAFPELEPVTDHSDVSTISKQPTPTLTKPKKVTLSSPRPKYELSNGLTPPLSDHCYWSDQTSSFREEEESPAPASATSSKVTPSPRSESKIDAREDSLEPLSILLPQTLKNQGQELLHHGVC